jgi:succinyl-CoA synthetase beta subunit
MLLLEHHGKALLRKHGIPTPRGVVVGDASALVEALPGLPERLVLKAQIAGGGRSKGGGIAFATGRKAVIDAFDSLRGSTVNGQAVDAVLVEEQFAFAQERYAGILIEDGDIWLLFARRGGIDIEDITVADASNLQAIALDPIAGPTDAQFQDCFDRLGYAPDYRANYARIGRALFDLSRSCDATMVEINPLVELAGDALVALDARILIDDSALDRQPEITALQPIAAKVGRLPFRENPEGGTIGLIGLGGGLNVTLMDWIADGGAQVAALVDIDDAVGAGHAEQGFAMALDAFDRHPQIRSILVNVITCGYRLDDIATGLVAALAKRDASRVKPAILHLRGNAMAETPELLRAAGQVNCASLATAVAAVLASAQD